MNPTNEFNTLTGKKLNPNESYINAQGQTITQGSVISPEVLTPQPKIDLTGTIPNLPDTGADILAGATQGTEAFDTDAEFKRQLELQKKTEGDQSPLTEAIRQLTASEQGLGGRGTAQLEAETTAGIPEAQRQRSTLQGQIKTQIAEYNALKAERDKLTADLEVGTRGAGNADIRASMLFGQQGAVERQFLARLNSKASDIAILQAQDQALAGDIETAQKSVDRAIDLKYQDRETELRIKQSQYDRIKDLLTKEETKRGKALEETLKKEAKALEEQKAEEKTAYGYLTTAIQGNAPASLIAKAQDLINKGAKATEVAKTLGRYSMSLSDRLDIQLKNKQIEKINKELTAVNTDAGELVKINGQDFIRYKDGTISNPVLPESGDLKTVVERLNDKITTVNNLAYDENGKRPLGLKYSAGSLRTPLGLPPGLRGEINDWRADVINVVSKLTVDELGRVKSDGVTFGALSNGEREAVGNAATVLSAGMIYKGEGDNKVPTGEFKISEGKVQQALDTINKYYKIDLERRSGVTYDEYRQNPDILNTKAVDDFINEAGNALINNNTYGGYSID